MHNVIESSDISTQTSAKLRSHIKPVAKAMRLRDSSGNIRVRKVDPLHILMIEDNPSDALLTRLAFEQCEIPGYISDEITDGNSAMQLLHHNKVCKNERHPDVILLDLGLPKRNGFEILSDIDKDKHLRKIPVIILTGFGNFKYLKDAYQESNIITYLQKPCTPGQMQEALFEVISRKYS